MSDFPNIPVPPEEASAEAEANYRLLQPKFEKLASEVEYIIRDALVEERIPIASLTKRVKTLASFSEKIRRKNYKDPATEVTDLAGVRVVSYFQGDLVRLEHMIGRQFRVLGKVDKSATQAVDRFGYRAVHFTVCLKGSYLGARYDDIKDLTCEIQTRPVLADAWAILDHYFIYKPKHLVPPEINRQMSLLCAVLENAEVQFEAIRQAVELHQTKARALNPDELLNQPVSPSTLAVFIERLSPGIEESDKGAEITRICSLIGNTNLKTIGDIDAAVRRTKKAMAALNKDTRVFPGQELSYALAFADPGMRSGFAEWFEALFKKHRHLVQAADV